MAALIIQTDEWKSIAKLSRGRLHWNNKELIPSRPCMRSHGGERRFPTPNIMVSASLHIFWWHSKWNIWSVLMRQMQLFICRMCLLSTHKALGPSLILTDTCLAQMLCRECVYTMYVPSRARQPSFRLLWSKRDGQETMQGHREGQKWQVVIAVE